MSDPQAKVRRDVLELLHGGGAHLRFEDAMAELSADKRGGKLPGQPHTPWRLLEHIRRAQHDILRFIVDPDYESPPWPDGYWPEGDAPPDDDAWDRAVRGYESDARKLERLIADPTTDLLAPIAHGEGQTILREAMLVADHTAYHLGQLVTVRKMLGAWPAE